MRITPRRRGGHPVDALTDAPEVAFEADLSDDNVKPLYEDLELHFTRLQNLVRK
jgi:hypothetical protein